MAPVRFAAIALLLTASLAVAEPPIKVHEDAELAASIDLHAACDKLARDCWNLDPLALGMNPVTTSIPPAPTGTVQELEGSQDLTVHAELMGQRIHLHGSVVADAEARHDADATPTPPVPCGDPDGCPDLRVDNVRLHDETFVSHETFSADHCAVDEGSTEPGNRTLLRFTFKSPNLGSGDLVVGDPDDHPEWFEWGQCHGHWHFREYADYRLWDLAGYAAWKTLRAAYPHAEPEAVLDAFPELREHFRAGHKQGFCVFDSETVLRIATTFPQYRDCGENQGITTQWADVYGWNLDGQWVDVTGLEADVYVLEAEVNPERFFAEENYGNNDAGVVVDLTGLV